MENNIKEIGSQEFTEDILAVLPYWHYAIDKNFKQSLKNKMSLESYYCLQTIRQKGSVTMSELAKQLKISKQQATQMVERLYCYQFICRSQDAADRRCVKIEITDKAREYISQMFYSDNDFWGNISKRIGDNDRQELAGAVKTLLRILPKLLD